MPNARIMMHQPAGAAPAALARHPGSGSGAPVSFCVRRGAAAGLCTGAVLAHRTGLTRRGGRRRHGLSG